MENSFQKIKAKSKELNLTSDNIKDVLILQKYADRYGILLYLDIEDKLKMKIVSDEKFNGKNKEKFEEFKKAVGDTAYDKINALSDLFDKFFGKLKK